MSGARSLADRARYFRGARRLVLQEGRRAGTEQRGGWGSQSISNRPLLNPSPYRRGLFSGPIYPEALEESAIREAISRAGQPGISRYIGGSSLL